MVERCRIRKLQLLAHQYLVSAKVEFYIGDREPASSQRVQQFRRLGFVSVMPHTQTKPGEIKRVILILLNSMTMF